MLVCFTGVTVGTLYELLTAGTWLTASDTALDVKRHSNDLLMDVTPESSRLLTLLSS